EGGHRHLGGVGREIAEADAATAGGVDHLVIGGLHFAHWHAPALGGGVFQHGARRSANLAHRHHIVTRATRSVGVLVAVFDLVAMRLLYLHALPVRHHLFGDDQ